MKTHGQAVAGGGKAPDGLDMEDAPEASYFPPAPVAREPPEVMKVRSFHPEAGVMHAHQRTRR